MKVKVVQGFRDKYTGKRYYPGEILDLTEERTEEILKKGKLVKVLEEPYKNIEIRLPRERLEKSAMQKMKLKDLQELARSVQIDSTGKKDELIERIYAEYRKGELENEESEN